MLQPGEGFPSEAAASATAAASQVTVTATAAAATSAAPATSTTAAAAVTASTGLSTGAIAGIAIGGVAVLALAGALFYFVGRSRTLKQSIEASHHGGTDYSAMGSTVGTATTYKSSPSMTHSQTGQWVGTLPSYAPVDTPNKQYAHASVDEIGSARSASPQPTNGYYANYSQPGSPPLSGHAVVYPYFNQAHAQPYQHHQQQQQQPQHTTVHTIELSGENGVASTWPRPAVHELDTRARASMTQEAEGEKKE